MGTNCSSLVADLFLYCYESDFMMSLSDDTQPDIIEAFNSISRYMNDLLHIDTPFVKCMVTPMYPNELQLNKDKSIDTVKR